MSRSKKATKKTPAKKRGRPPGPRTKLDDLLISRIVERIRAAFYVKHAIESLGHSERSFYKWMARGEDEVQRMEEAGTERPRAREAIFVRLFKEVRRAQADNIRAHATNIQRNALGQAAEYLKDDKGQVVLDKNRQPILIQPAIPPNWQASARYLEAVDHERWGRKVRQELTTPEGGPSELRITVVEKRKIKKEELEDV